MLGEAADRRRRGDGRQDDPCGYGGRRGRGCKQPSRPTDMRRKRPARAIITPDGAGTVWINHAARPLSVPQAA